MDEARNGRIPRLIVATPSSRYASRPSKRYIGEEKSRGGGRGEFNRVEFRGIRFEKEEVTFAIDRVELR